MQTTDRFDRFDAKRILTALSAFSSASIIAVLFSIATSKLIAVYGGREGVGLMGLYRGLGGLVTGVAALGFSMIITQKISTSRSREDTENIIGASTLLLLLQGLSVFTLGLFFPGLIARWLFTGALLPSHLVEVRVVLLMAFINLALQTVLAVLKGQSDIKPISLVQIVTAVSSLAVIYPLLLWGRLGLAVNVGSGGIFGCLFGLWYIWKIFRPSLLKSSFPRWWSVLTTSGLSAGLLTLHSFAMVAGLLALQAMINDHYGLAALGEYNAAMMVFETAILLMMSSIRTYAIPAFGSIDGEKEKADLFEKLTVFLLLLNLGVAGFLVVFSGPIIRILFSKEFVEADRLLTVFGIGLIGSSLTYMYNTFLVHKGDYAPTVALDVVWMAGIVGGTGLCLQVGLPLISVVWLYSLCTIVLAAAYAVWTTRQYGPGYLSGRISRISVIGSLWFFGGLWASNHGLLYACMVLGTGPFLCAYLLMPRGKMGYIMVEIPRRLMKYALRLIFGFHPWHIHSVANKPYAVDIQAFLNKRKPKAVAEIGCGLGDILAGVKAEQRYGFDVEESVVRAARVYRLFSFPRIKFDLYDFLAQEIPDIKADVWILVNCLHSYSHEQITPRLRELCASLPAGGIIILDAWSKSEASNHDVLKIFEKMGNKIYVVSPDHGDGKTFFCVEKPC